MDETMQNNPNKRWLVILGTVLVQIGVGSFYAWSVFSVGIQQMTGATAKVVNGVPTLVGGIKPATISFTFTLGMLSLALATLIAPNLIKRFGIRNVNIVMGILYGIAVIALTTIHSTGQLALLWLFGGVLLGATDGIAYITTLSNAIKWFPERTGLISGIAVASYGLGSFIFKYIDLGVAGSLGKITGTNITKTLMVWGVLAMIIIVVGAFFLKDAPEHPVVKSTASGSNNFTTKEMLHTPQAYLIFICLTTAVAFMGLLGAAVTPMASKWLGEPATWAGTAAAASFVAIVAIANTIGRFVLGALSDVIGRKSVFFITFTIQLIAIVMLLLNQTMSALLVNLVIIAMAFSFGGNITVFPTFVGDYFGLEHHTRNYSLIYQGFGVGAILAGFLLASGNPLNPPKTMPLNFHLTLVVLLAMVIVSLVILVFIRKPVKHA
ncbi:MFS transporter [Weissella muntiaci]|uniref:MFS transporter n=1 Tax=Weissella muntiaci TaxID=2508881 RepID=A0A6C2C4C2_9LACO|nr:OFA family MFS transporter [Weissella muntiaci]TYC48185.1 MFS transporter [Weissella muntiaci]